MLCISLPLSTPCYMDPEYLRTGRFGPKSDVYSLGEAYAGALTGAPSDVMHFERQVLA